jgi:hypothetical protein
VKVEQGAPEGSPAITVRIHVTQPSVSRGKSMGDITRTTGSRPTVSSQ